jgi:putative transposase
VSAELKFPVTRVCLLIGAARSSVHARRTLKASDTRRGPRPKVSDEEVKGKIRQLVGSAPFAGEGYRKIRARLAREHKVQVGGKRVLRLMRQLNLLAPQRSRGRRKPRPHDGSIVPPEPNSMWGTDATLAWTRRDGWVWTFVNVDHYTAEAWATVARRGDRFAALEPIYDAINDRFGQVAPDVARGIQLRHDWGPQYLSGHFQATLKWLGIEDSPAYAGEPSCNGCAERFIRTLKEQCLWASLHEDIDDLREAVRLFVERYNSNWLIERHGHRTPREAHEAWLASRQKVA